MKKSSVGSLVVIIGLLILSVLTLTVIYATSPETSVVLLDENFTDLDYGRWKQEITECTEDGDLYECTAEEGFAADGILRVQPNLTSPEFRIKRENPRKCNPCPGCSTFPFSAIIETKSLFYASSGLVEVRAKFRKGNRLKFRIALISNDSKSEDINDSVETSEEPANDSAQLEIVFESAFNRTVLKSDVTDEDFHIYEIEWNADRITFRTDHKKVDERTFEPNQTAKNSSNSTSAVDTQPFSLSMGVDFGEKFTENSATHSQKRASTDRRNQYKFQFEGEAILEIDYVRLFRIESTKWKFL